MATYSITHHQRVDGVAVVQTLEETDIAVGQSFSLSGLGHSLNGTHTLVAVPQYLFLGLTESGDFIFDYDVIILNQLLFIDGGTDLERSAADPYGTLTYTVSVSWITSSQVTEFLGIASATANDTAFLATCTAASNAWCYRKRLEAGYSDEMNASPGADVTLGAVIYAAMNYRERGSIDSFQTYDGMGTAPVMSMGRVMQLLGCNRSQVA